MDQHNWQECGYTPDDELVLRCKDCGLTVISEDDKDYPRTCKKKSIAIIHDGNKVYVTGLVEAIIENRKEVLKELAKK